VRVAASAEADSATALDAAYAQLELPPAPRLVLVLAAPRYDLALIGAELEKRLPDCAVLGCSSSGEIAGAEALRQSLVLWVLGGSGIRVSTGWGQREAQGSLRLAATAAATCLNQLERRRHTVLLLLSDGLSGDQMEVVRGAYDVAHVDVPLVGGCAGDNLVMRHTQQLHGHQVLSDAVVAAAISSDRPLGVGVSHGWTPVSEPMLVTSSQGTELLSLDDRPALDAYLDFFQPEAGIEHDAQGFASFAATHPIGIRRRDKIEMRHITGCDLERRSLITVAEVPTGALAFLSQGDLQSVLGAAEASCRAALGGLGRCRPAGILLFDCVARRAVFGEEQIHQETERIAASCGAVPMAGFYTYGEIARTKGAGGFHNQTLVTLAIA
jgi:hypothetical protein